MLVDNLFQLQIQDLGSNLNWNEELQGSVEAHTHPVFSGVKADPVSTALLADMVFAVCLSSSSPPGHQPASVQRLFHTFIAMVWPFLKGHLLFNWYIQN